MTPKCWSKLLANPAGQLVGIAVVAVGLATVSPPLRAQEGVNPRGAIVKAFMERVDEYVKLQKKIAGELPALKPTDEPSKIEVNQAAVAARIRLASPNAKRGDIFGDAEPLIREVIVHDARSVRDEWAAMQEVPAHDPLKVHATYPETAPLATVPPLILTNLPPLPEGIEYRFMGRDLILRDVRANLVADFINDAVPTVKGK